MNRILLGSDAFKSRFETVAKEAKDSLLVQAMTFEGDDAGEWLINTMQSSPAKDKRLLVDCYSKVVINDHFIFSLKYIFDEGFRNEVKNTKKVLELAKENGIDYQFINPVGLFGQKYPLRNHKKMVIIDKKYSYLGGINFSDHNFAWHDMMIELEDDQIGHSLTNDFNSTWGKKNQSKRVQLDAGELFFFNGVKSKTLYDDLFAHLKEARESVQVISPYISEPLLPVLQEISKNGINVEVISPSENNKSLFRNLILSESKKGYFGLKEFKGMSHMKAIMIDDEKLIFGSSNYDVVSYYFEQEVVMVSYDKELIKDFRAKVLDKVEEIGDEKLSPFDSWKAAVLMKLLNGFGKLTSNSILKPH